MRSARAKVLRGTLGIRRSSGNARNRTWYEVRINTRAWSVPSSQQSVTTWTRKWFEYWTRQGAWNKLNQPKGKTVIRVLIRKEQPFEIHVVVNPTDALDPAKIEAQGHFHVGDFDGEKQIDEAVSAVATYLELEESHSEV